MFGGGSERGPQRRPMSDLCVLAIRTCLPNESETKSKFQLFSLLAYEETGQDHCDSRDFCFQTFQASMSRVGYLAFVVARGERAGLRLVNLPCLWVQGPLREKGFLWSSGRGTPRGVPFLRIL